MGLFGPANPVFAMLQKDHQKVKDLFDEFERADDARTKRRIMNDAIQQLEVHVKLEESLIYPALRKEIDDEKVMDEALEEHHVAHVLLNELKRMKGNSTDRYEAKFKVLGESIKHHVKEEEGTMFPKAEKADLDWDALAKKAMTRKEALLAKQSSGRGRTAQTSKRMHGRGRRGQTGPSRKAA